MVIVLFFYILIAILNYFPIIHLLLHDQIKEKTNMKKINCLITGISGMVGSHLLDFLLKNTNWNIYGLVRWSSKLDNIEHHLDKINKGQRIFLEYGDLTDQVSIRKVINNSLPQYVFHLAAESFPKMSFDAPLKFYETNVKGTQILLEEIKDCKKIDPIVHICSSSEVFGKVKKKRFTHQ